MSLIGKQIRIQLQEFLLPEGFARRGSAFFRVWGDGVLQVVKPEYEIHGEYHSLSLGLFSMYDSLIEQWFTGSGCIPRYPVVNLMGKRSEYESYLRIEEQISVMKRYGIDFLNGIDDQEKLIKAICQLDIVCSGQIHMNDKEKYAPYLYIGDRTNAAEVIFAILRQHGVPHELTSNIPDILLARSKKEPNHVVPEVEKKQLFDYFARLQLALYGEQEEIQNWFQANYDRNKNFAKFCMK